MYSQQQTGFIPVLVLVTLGASQYYGYFDVTAYTGPAFTFSVGKPGLYFTSKVLL
jgi:hypothetical protein